MILTKEIEITIIPRLMKYWGNILNKEVKKGEIISVDPTLLPKHSKKKVKVECDVCGLIKEICLSSYWINIEKYNFYSCSQKCSYKTKNIKTNLEKYGVESYTQTKEYLIKSKKTKLEKHGNENWVNLEKMKETNLEKYGVEYYMQTEEFKQKSIDTNLEKYGVERPLQNEKIKNKWMNTNIEKYGYKTPLMNEDIKNKISNTKLEKYNDKNYNNRIKYKETCIKLFGFENPMQNEHIKEKLKNIIFERWGVYYPAQLPMFFDKMLKSGLKMKKYDNSDIYYQGTYEKDFLDKYYNQIKINRGKAIKYIYDGTEHIYYPDFYNEELNLIIEIKSTHWFNEHLDKNLEKEKACKKLGYNFVFIIDKDYTKFQEIIKIKTYNKNHSWQYDIRQKTLKKDIYNLDFDHEGLNINDFEFEFIDKDDPLTKDIVNFIKKYEWLGNMPNRPTHRFIATYNGNLAGVIVMSTPNAFSNLLGENTRNIEKLISRGACASWTPKNLASSLIMFSIRWMVKNTNFRLFSAYGDTEAKELGTIYQACNFIYLGQKYGSTKLYFDQELSHLGWTTGRNYSKLNFYKSYLRGNNIIWDDKWNLKTKILWDNIPDNIVIKMKYHTKKCKERCLVRKAIPKHKYVYILGKDKKETKLYKKIFKGLNPKLINLPYPKIR
jgi:hypothetical protein